MRTQRTKSIPARTMRGYEGLTGWVLLMSSAPGKRWDPCKTASAFQSIRAFVAMAGVNKKLSSKNSKHERQLTPSPLRLLAPGGIIAAESHVRRLVKPRKPLVSTASLRPSIIAPAFEPEPALAPVAGGFTPRTTPSFQSSPYPHRTTLANPRA